MLDGRRDSGEPRGEHGGEPTTAENDHQLFNGVSALHMSTYAGGAAAGISVGDSSGDISGAGLGTGLPARAEERDVLAMEYRAAREWYYRDDAGEEQGPFEQEQLEEWFADDYLPLHLEAREMRPRCRRGAVEMQSRYSRGV